ncbi:unnamed protein product, partial [Amoebophrya sp. A25]
PLPLHNVAYAPLSIHPLVSHSPLPLLACKLKTKPPSHRFPLSYVVIVNLTFFST